MAFTKIVLAGVEDTIKGMSNRFNTLVDDLISTASGKGASQIGIEDLAGNLDAVNIEDAIAEIYTDTASTRTLADIFSEDSSTTTGLTWGYKAGIIRNDSVVTTVAAGTISLTDDATNYIEITAAGVVTRNTTSFTSGRIPIRTIITVGGAQTSSTDSRAWFDVVSTVPSATTAVSGSVRLATDAEAQAGVVTDAAIVPSSLSSRTATTTRTGIAELATTTESVQGTANDKIVTPEGLTSRLATPGAIGGTTPSAGTFTTLAGTTIDGTLGSITPAAATVTTFTSTGIDDNATENAITISSDEVVTMPKQPAFSVYASADQLNPANNATIVFDTEIFDKANNFSANTFTAPVTGKYQLNLLVRTAQVDADYTELGFKIVTSNRNYNFYITPSIFDSDGVCDQSFSVLADMDANDTASCQITFSGAGAQIDLMTGSFFSGFLAN